MVGFGTLIPELVFSSPLGCVGQTVTAASSSQTSYYRQLENISGGSDNPSGFLSPPQLDPACFGSAVSWEHSEPEPIVDEGAKIKQKWRRRYLPEANQGMLFTLRCCWKRK